MKYFCEKCLISFKNQRAWAGHLANHKRSENAFNFVDEFVEIKKSCSKCGKEFIIKARKNRKDKEKLVFYNTNFCSRSCANSRDRSLELREKISKLRKLKLPDKFCLDCKKLLSRKNNTGYCRSCAPKHFNGTPEARQKQSTLAKARVADGTHKGWTSRKISSYPEKFFIEVLHNNRLDKDIDYKFNFCIPKFSLGVKSCANYFLDFYFQNKKIDLEIDGKQHLYKDRIESDEERDKLLKENGFIVYRIKWKSINNDAGKAYMKNEIEKFLDFYSKSS